MSDPRGRALGHRYFAAPWLPQAGEAQGRRRGLYERLIVLDPETDEPLDLGPVLPTCWTLTFALLASASQALTLDFPTDAGSLVTSLRAFSAGPVLAAPEFTVTFADITDGKARPWQDTPVRNTLLFGDGEQPLRLWSPEGTGPGAQLIPPGGKLRIICTDLSAAANAVMITVEGLRIERGLEHLKRLWQLASQTIFMQGVGFTIPGVVGAAVAPPPRIQVDGDTPLLIHHVNSTEKSGWDLNFSTINNAEPWFDGNVPIESFAGTGFQPGGFSMPRGCAAGEDLKVTAVNRTAAPIVVGQLLLIGSKDWRSAGR